MGAVLSTKAKVSRVAPEGARARAERRAALLALACCKRRQDQSLADDLDVDPVDVEAPECEPFGAEKDSRGPMDADAPQCEPSGAEKDLQECDGCQAARPRFDSDGSTACFSEGRSRWGTDETFVTEGRSRWGTGETVATEGRSRWGTDDTVVAEGRSRWGTDDTVAAESRSRWGTDETFATEGRSRWGTDDTVVAEGTSMFGTDDALVSEGHARFDTEDVVLRFEAIPEVPAEAGAATPMGFGEESATDAGAVSSAATEPGAMNARAFNKESATGAGAVSDAVTEPAAMNARAFSKESAAWSGASTAPGALTPLAFASEESEVVPDPVFRWALSGREIDVADLTASDSALEAREKIAKTIGSSAKLLRLLGPDGRQLEDESAIGVGGLVYGRDPDEVEREEKAAAQRAAQDAVVALMRGW